MDEALLALASDPSDWPPEWSQVRPLDASLRCGLCFDIFRAPVALRECGHVFCSQCIRMHINQAAGAGAFCPQCRQKKAYDAELVPQPALEGAADAWRTALPFLAKACGDMQTCIDELAALQAEIAAGTAGPSTRAAVPPSPPAKRRRTRAEIDYRELPDEHLVQCPICMHELPAAELNTHLDLGCAQPPPSHTADEKRLTRPQYQLKNERDLRRMLQGLGLATNGNRERLVERHRHWVNLYNANLDAAPARRESMRELRKQLASWERAQDDDSRRSRVDPHQYKSWLVRSMLTAQ